MSDTLIALSANLSKAPANLSDIPPNLRFISTCALAYSSNVALAFSAVSLISLNPDISFASSSGVMPCLFSFVERFIQSSTLFESLSRISLSAPRLIPSNI